MSLSIQGHTLLSFNRTLSHEALKRAIYSSSKEEATQIGIWDKIKDWFCGTNTSEALEKIYELTHGNNEPDTESISQKVTAFYQLKEMAYPVYQDRFQATIAPNEYGAYIFSFSIKDVMDERAWIYGKAEKDIDSLNQRELTNNNSELLDNIIVTREGLNVALNQVKYDEQKNQFENVLLGNQGRVNLHLLDKETKQEMAINPRLAQKWISLQMKCFDYYAEQRLSLESVKGLNITLVMGTENEWIYHFIESINEIKRNTQENLAKEFNNEIKEFNDLNIYANPYELNKDPIYSEPYNQSNEPIYEDIQFNSLETSSNKYYKGPINGDIYAKVDKKKY